MSTSSSFVTPIFSGAGVGILLGVLIGLSISPIVGTVVGGLVGLLAAILGLTDAQLLKSTPKVADLESTEDSNESMGNEGATNIEHRNRRLREVRVGSFGAACTVGVLLGMFIRITEPFSPSIASQVEQWENAHFTRSRAQELVTYRELRIRPGTDESVADSDQSLNSKLSVLFANEDGECSNLDPDLFSDADAALRAWEIEQEDPWLSAAGIVRERIPSPEQLGVIRSIWKLTCDIGSQ